ncbi:MAG: hypothetical protein HY698_12565 [Deltaproteobacteria bacterium]|nr:hypothetical protein [Deltaproteobacteria bacterium]
MLIRILAPILVAFVPQVASAQREPLEVTADEAGAPDAREFEIGARLGMQLGVGGSTAGGIRVGGVFLQRLTQNTWFDGEVSLALGARRAGCEVTECDHGMTDGFGMQALLGGRYMLAPRPGGLDPYLRAAAGISASRFSRDHATGLAFPISLGAGGRFRVIDGLAMGGELLLQGGAARFGDSLGYEPHGAVIVQLGAEFGL